MYYVIKLVVVFESRSKYWYYWYFGINLTCLTITVISWKKYTLC